jgi:NADH:ubiquinone oxidoreductase subunit 3 (subunit A)
MGESAFLLLCAYSTVFSLIFWILTLCFRFFYYNKQKKRKLEFYECGFNSSIGLKIHISLSYFLILLFFILYDLEFLGFFLFSFFIINSTLLVWFNFIIFYILLLLCFLIDYIFNLLDFVVR